MINKKSLIIHGPLKDLGDLLNIARAEGSKVLSCEKITVSPQIFCMGNDFVVIVSPKEPGCSKPTSCMRVQQSKMSNEGNHKTKTDSENNPKTSPDYPHPPLAKCP
jgi:hypothetical protein